MENSTYTHIENSEEEILTYKNFNAESAEVAGKLCELYC